MIERLNGEGQGCCDICLHVKGFHRNWSSGLYYIRNKRGLYLRIFPDGDRFSANQERVQAAFCYHHALEVDEVRKHQTGYDKGE